MSFKMPPQPTDTTCGPTCLFALYQHYNCPIELTTLIEDVQFLKAGGTLSVLLGIDALKRGFKVKIYPYNLKIFDPSWYHLPAAELILKLKQQMDVKDNALLTEASKAYIHYLEMGGHLIFEDLTPNLLRHYLQQPTPILTGLSATYLYQEKREYAPSAQESISDDIKGEPLGHFVVLSDLADHNHVNIADPYPENPLNNRYYTVEMQRLINAILLGIVTYDANLLVLEPQ